MAKLYPFRGFRYSATKVGRVDDVVTQPYDKIPEALRQEYLKRHPKNIVRIIKNKDYGEAAQCWKDWCEEGVLFRDEKPALYAYEQEFLFDGEKISRLGLICLISLDDPDLAMKGHERVLDKPLEDRLNLIRATKANEGLIFSLFSEKEGRTDKLLAESVESKKPDCEVVDDYGTIHRIWLITDPAVVSEIRDIASGKALYIADGHHRFQTSVLYHRECLEKGLKPKGDESFDKRMIALFNMESPGVRILATHRAIRNLKQFDLTQFLSALSKNFEVTLCESEQALADALSSGDGRLGFLVGKECSPYVLTLKKSALADSKFMSGIEGVSRELDVNILHEGILNPILKIGVAELASQSFVDYYRDRLEMASGLREGKYQLGFLLRPTSLEQVRAVSEVGQKMPQKSTDFYPKLLTGLVLMKMEMDGTAE